MLDFDRYDYANEYAPDMNTQVPIGIRLFACEDEDTEEDTVIYSC